MKLGFIGIGRIATAVIKGFCSSNIENVKINISPRGVENSRLLRSNYPELVRMDSNQSVLDHSDIIFIATPADHSKSILQELKFKSNHIVVSFVSLLTSAELAGIVKPAVKICRAIPLPTVEKHNCPIPVFHGDENVLSLFKHLGTPIPVHNEADLHTLWALTGLIAPFYDLCETMSEWAQSKGVDASVAKRYVIDVFWSLTSSAEETKLNFKDLKNEATTPNGLNDQALKIIHEEKAHEAYQAAANALLKRFKDVDNA